MLEKSDIETIAKEVFREFGLNWEVFHVDPPQHRWWIRARMPDHRYVFADFCPINGSRDVVKKLLAEMVKSKLEELDSK
jgi:hypothetical protein